MKRIAMVFTVILMLTPLMAHNGTQVKKMNELLKLRNAENVQFQEVKLPMMAKYVQKLKKAKNGDLSFFLFSAKGDWGPFSGLITLKAGTIVAVDILSFTRHDSDAFTKPAFLGQFTGLKMMAFHNREFKAVPGEPLNLKALKEALMLAFHNGMGMMGHGMMQNNN
ncbi:MAG: hypothetical protein GXO70_09655 [Acidobacteria bacterium]|nr:hypothetical protein [Acidobacteriota bacterium]